MQREVRRRRHLISIIGEPHPAILSGSGSETWVIERPASWPIDTWPLIGRLDDLERSLAWLNNPGNRGVSIHGSPGVGRTRFLAEVVAATPSSRRLLQAVGTTTTRTIALGAFAHLLDGTLVLPSGPSSAFEGDAARHALVTNAANVIIAGGPVVVAIDDAHLLDPTSITLLQMLASSEDVSIALTVCSSETTPDSLSMLWRHERLARVDLAPLTLESTNALLQIALAAPVDGRAARLLFDASAGLPLLLREIVRTALDHGTLILVDGVWRLRGPLPLADRVTELASQRIDTYDEAEIAVLELLAVVGPTPLGLVELMASDSTLERLEAEALVRILESSDAGHDLVLRRHPVNEAILANVTSLRRRNIRRDHADRYLEWSDGGPAAQLTVAALRFDAGIIGDPSEMERMSTLARNAEDFELVLRFARSADRAIATLRSAVLLCDALYELCRWDECERVIARSIHREGAVVDRVRLTGLRGVNLLFGLMRSTDAIVMTETALAELDAGDEYWRTDLDADGVARVREELVNRTALLQMYGGDPGAALDTMGSQPAPVPAGPDDSSEARSALYARVLWAIPSIPAIALSGRTNWAVALATEAADEHMRLGGEVGSSSVGTHWITLALAQQEHGALADARRTASMGYDASISAGQLIGQIWFGLSLARAGLLAGHPESVLRWTREVIAATSSAGWLGPRLMALNGMAAAHAQLGDLSAARRCLVDAAAIDGDFGFLRPERVVGEATLAAAEGRVADARKLLIAAADVAATTGHLTVEAWLRFDAVRLGSRREIDRLAELASICDSPLVAARAAAARAMEEDDAELLEAAATAMDSMGLDLVAAELYGLAVDALRRTKRSRAAAAVNLRAVSALERTEGAQPLRPTRLDIVVPLTQREREIVVMATSGLASKVIATRLGLSVRTVTNHLQNAYAKLGVSTRADAADALGITP